jgi:hypothetical protein
LYKLACILLTLLFSQCKKEKVEDIPAVQDSIPTNSNFKLYTIQQGRQYCDQNTIKIVNLNRLQFDVIFDSTAIYSTLDPVNQYDINKLYGFSEGINHQYNSARMGWRWSSDSLRLFGYVYNNGTRISEEISTISIGDTIPCSIQVIDSTYQFKVGNKQIQLSRTAVGDSANGYQLYPYFGGDELSPQLIRIKIKEY